MSLLQNKTQVSRYESRGGRLAEPLLAKGPLPSVELQHAWFELARMRTWRLLTLVPVEEGHHTIGIAHDLACMASLDPNERVLVVNAVAQEGRGTGPRDRNGMRADVEALTVRMANGRYTYLDLGSAGYDEAQIALVEVPRLAEQVRLKTGPYTMLIMAQCELLTHPTAVPVARAMDAAIICARLGSSSFRYAKKAIELIGKERVIGSLAVRPKVEQFAVAPEMSFAESDAVGTEDSDATVISSAYSS